MASWFGHVVRILDYLVCVLQREALKRTSKPKSERGFGLRFVAVLLAPYKIGKIGKIVNLGAVL